MTRALLWLAVIALGVWVWRQRRRPAPPQANRTAQALPTRRCAHCGTYVPAGSALMQDDAAYCCAEHARRGPGARH